MGSSLFSMVYVYPVGTLKLPGEVLIWLRLVYYPLYYSSRGNGCSHLT